MLLTPLIAAVTFWSPAPDGWTADYRHALAKATELGRPIMANFTGSDWCTYCKKLKANVFSQKEFADWASKNVVLLELDYPHNVYLPRQVVAQNEELQGTYGRFVSGFPTILMLDPKGRPFAKLGYQQVGASDWLASADKSIEAFRDQAKANP